MTGTEFVRKIFDEPNMSDEKASCILWGCTGYPSFYIGEDRIKYFTKQLQHAKRSLKRGYTIDEIFEGRDLATKFLPEPLSTGSDSDS